MVGVVGANRTTLRQNDLSTRIRFGGGLNTRASVDEVGERECARGENFTLDFRNTRFRRREPFTRFGVRAPNGQPIRGFANLVKADGTASILVQAGGTVYQVTNNGSTWTPKGSCNAASRLRGHRSQVFELNDVVIITDTELLTPVMVWNGTTLSTMAHNLGGTFYAKYCFVANERAIYANVISNAVATPHLVCGSKISDYDNLTTTDRPSSSLGEGDPWYLLTPDLKAVNGLVGAFGLVAISSRRGQMWKLSGASAQDFSLQSLHPDSAASGDESMAFIGNDIVYGRQGRLESLAGTDRFGDVETTDLSRDIANAIESYESWQIAYNSRVQRVYFHPEGVEEMWVYHKPMAETEWSPWSKWTTRHAMAMNPSAMMSMIDPTDGLEYTFVGDESGYVYRLEGSGTAGDGGTTAIKAFRRSALQSAPGTAELYNIEGFLKYVVDQATTATIRILYQGEKVFDTVKTLALVGDPTTAVYGGQYYHGSGASTVYGSAFRGKVIRERFAAEGQANDFQVEIEVDTKANFEITEVQLAFSAAG